MFATNDTKIPFDKRNQSCLVCTVTEQDLYQVSCKMTNNFEERVRQLLHTIFICVREVNTVSENQVFKQSSPGQAPKMSQPVKACDGLLI